MMIEIKQILKKEKYMDLLLKADPNEELVKKYLKNSEMYGLFKNNELLCEAVIIENRR
ncbi:MAG: hypothetical protein Q4G09_06595 [Clostridia bacterium]|nr:hypothetical protein [Clostridia bacterium]